LNTEGMARDLDGTDYALMADDAYDVDPVQERAFGRTDAEVARRVALVPLGVADAVNRYVGEESMATEPQWTIVVSIGRNVDRAPMDDDAWEGFRSDVDRALRHRDVTVFFAGTGTGEYDGVREESATWVGATMRRPNTALETTLGVLAQWYDQKSIAVTYGTTVLVGPNGYRTEV